MQRPTVDGLNVFLVSQAVASLGIRTALSGMGGDEVLAGYPAFKLLRFLPLLRAGDRMSATRLLTRAYRGDSAKLAHLLSPAGPRNAHGLGQLFRRVLMDDQIRRLVPWTPTSGPVDASRDCSAHRLSLSEITRYLGGTLLPDTDANSMAWSIEMRVPFVDVKFASAVLAIDHKRGLDKRRFARTLGSPELVSIAQRRKQSFNLPMDRWMRSGPLAHAVRAAESPTAPVRQLLRPEGIDRIVDGWRAGRLTWSRAWSLIALNSWLYNLDDLHGIGSPVLEESDTEREAVG
jgi:asparagine synthase (glutamine-hydrolysing)